MAIKGIFHVNVNCSDLDRSLPFYENLGFPLIVDTGFEKGHPIMMRHPSGVVLNLLGSFKALGTLMAVGMMVLPATAARYWVETMTGYVVVTFLFTLLSAWVGLIVSFYLPGVPSGPAIVLIAGIFFFFSVMFAPQGLYLSTYLRNVRCALAARIHPYRSER